MQRKTDRLETFHGPCGWTSNVMVAGLLMLFAVSPAILSGQESNWPQWRGPHGSGKTSSTGVATQWSPDQNIQWRIELPEPGNSTPIVWNDRIFLTQPSAGNHQRMLLCFDRKSGSELWRQSVSYSEAEATHKTNPYCSASPVTDGERVVAWFGSAGLFCWDFEGRELWRRELGKQDHMWGYGSSPILFEDLCILNFGPGNRESIIAVDKTSGATRWQIDSIDDQQEREFSGPENDGNANDFTSNKDRNERLRGSWNTPIIVNVDGSAELVAVLPRRVVALNPATGDLLWTCGDAAPLAYASPIESDGVVIVLGGYGGSSLAVRPGGRGDVTQSHRLWHKSKDKGWLGTGIAYDGAVYVCDIGGVLSCIDVQTGEELWKHRSDGGATWSSITQSADGTMYLLTKSGATTVFRPDRKEFQLVAENSLNETSNASVVIAGDDVIIRTDRALWSISDGSQSGK